MIAANVPTAISSSGHLSHPTSPIEYPCGSRLSRAEVFEAQVDQFLGPVIRVASAFPLHGEITPIAGGLGDLETLRDIHGIHLAVVHFRVLSMGDVVSVLEHRLHRPIVE